MQLPESPRRVRVSVPATSANLGPGFDAVGIALELRGEVTVAICDRPPATLGRGEAMARQAVERVFQEYGRTAPPTQIAFDSTIPIARGLGASAVVRVGAAVAAAALCGDDRDRARLLDLATELEGHPDNVAPALLGGLQVVVRDGEQVRNVTVPFPPHLQAVLFVPDFEMPTAESRRLLPNSLSRTDAVHNSSRVALLVAAMATGRVDLLGIATDDRLHQPARSQLFPGMYEIIHAATDAGALCAYLSGGGSTILAIVERLASRVADAMASTAARAGTHGATIITAFSKRGAEVIEIA